MKIAFYTLGCKVNQYETEVLKALFVADGWDIVETDEKADAYVINSCTVTALGDKKTRQSIHKFKRQNPKCILALTGCFPQAFPEIEKKLPEADIITGASNRSLLPELFRNFIQEKKRIISIIPHKKGDPFESMSVSNFSEKTRAFIKIEDGCDRYCSYCIIPTARGHIRSKPLDELKTEAQNLAENNYKEIVLVGINLSSYGRDLENATLLDAIKLCASTKGIERVRLGSLEPELLSNQTIEELAKIPEFCPQFHLSLQSGSDSVLKRMNRYYDTLEYTRIVEAIRFYFKNPSITTDVMVGFPGETEEEFLESLNFVKNTGFAKTHVFPYSVRPGTKAATMPNQLTRTTKQKRVKLMSEAADHAKINFLTSQLDKVHQVLFETQEKNIAKGYTMNYIQISAHSKDDLRGKIKYAKIETVANDICTCKII